MKRLFAVIIVFVCITTVSFAEPWRVFDNAGLFSTEDVEAIEQAIYTFQRETNLDFAVLTTDDYLGYNNRTAIADSFYDSENFGFGRLASGMLYYLDMNQKYPCVSTCGEMIGIFDTDTLDEAFDASHHFLVAGCFKDAVLHMIESATAAVAAYKKDAD